MILADDTLTDTMESLPATSIQDLTRQGNLWHYLSSDASHNKLGNRGYAGTFHDPAEHYEDRNKAGSRQTRCLESGLQFFAV